MYAGSRAFSEDNLFVHAGFRLYTSGAFSDVNLFLG